MVCVEHIPLATYLLLTLSVLLKKVENSTLASDAMYSVSSKSVTACSLYFNMRVLSDGYDDLLLSHIGI